MKLSGMFGRDVKTVDKHVNNAFQEGLANLANLIVAKFVTTVLMVKRMKDRI